MPQSTLTHNPFGLLKGMEKRHTPPPPVSALPAESEKKTDARSEEELFRQAVAGVRPIEQDRVAKKIAPGQASDASGRTVEEDALTQLTRLIRRGEGFAVADTPEYMEGTGYRVPPEFAARLHRGDFSIQGHIDLHGLTVASAREAFDQFMKESMHAGKRAVLIIHGRGLSSPGEAVLKNKVREWLGQSYWLKRVIAYASAPSYDGGAGATYVLFRSRPLAKKKKTARRGR